MVVLGSGALACEPDLNQPKLADLSATIAAYESPRGVLTPDNVEAMLAKAATRLRHLNDAEPRQIIAATVGELEAELEERGVLDSSAKDQHGPLRVDASLRLQLRCVETGATKAGSMKLETRIDANELAPVIQGQAHDCVFLSSESRETDSGSTATTTLDGELFLHLYDPLQTPLDQAQFLLVMDGTLTSSEHSEPLYDVDMRLRGASLEIRLEVEDAEVIAFAEHGQLGIRDALARYTCELESRQCSTDDGRTLTW